MAKVTLETFKNFFKYYNEEEHQIRALEMLYREPTSQYLTTSCTMIQLGFNNIGIRLMNL